MSFPTELTNAIDGVTEVVAAHLNNLEAKVGTDNSAVPTSLDYLLKNAASIDPGHKHSKLWAADGSPEAVTVDAAGNVGMGTANPLGKLNIVGGSVNVGAYTTDRGLPLSVRSTGTSYTLAVSRNNSNTEGLVFGVDGSNCGLIGSNNADTYLGYWAAGVLAKTLTIQSTSGNVGIGTTSPGKKLDVNGYIRGTGIFNTLNSAPADGDLAAGECAWWFDKTNGAAKLMIKAKQNDGTVKTASISLS